MDLFSICWLKLEYFETDEQTVALDTDGYSLTN